MARAVDKRYVILGNLVAVTPLHVGSGSTNVDSDLPVARDGQHRLYVPGTSLAGLFRSYLRRYCRSKEIGSDRFEKLLGFQRRDEGWASQLVIEDAVIESEVTPELRDHVGIDRCAGTAAERIKFDRQVIPAGTVLPLRMTLDCLDTEQAQWAKQALDSLIAALQEKHLRLGAAKSRGLGLLGLRDCRIWTYSLSTRSGILGYLREQRSEGPPSGGHELQADPKSVARPTSVEFKIHWRARGAMMVKAAMEGRGADFLPLMSGQGMGLLPVLPGSSQKGVFRAEAERILRTLLRPQLSGHADSKRRFINQLNDPSLELVHWLFGRMSTVGSEAENETGDLLPGYSAIRFDDCFPKVGEDGGMQPLPLFVWQQMRNASVDPERHTGETAPRTRPNELARLLDEHGLPEWGTAFHVAIDRWSGGASDGMLFTVLEPRRIPWQPLKIEVDLDRIPLKLHLPCVALLLLVLQRFCDGAMPLGSCGNRGMGEVDVEGIEVTGHQLPESLAWLNQRHFATFNLQGLDADFIDSLRTAWKQYLSNNSDAAVSP